MRKLFILTVCLCMTYALTAQETSVLKEFGLTTTSLSDFGLTFRFGNNNSVWRFNTFAIAGTNNQYQEDSQLDKQGSISFNAGIGKEYRKSIDEKLELRVGADISFAYGHSKSNLNTSYPTISERIRTTNMYRPGINMVMGMNYKLNEKLILGIEFLPGISYSNSTTTVTKVGDNVMVSENVSESLNYNLSNNSLLLSLAYRL